MKPEALSPAEWAEHARLLRNQIALTRTRLWSLYPDARAEAQREIEVASRIVAWIEHPRLPVPAADWLAHAADCRRVAACHRGTAARFFSDDPAMTAALQRDAEAELRFAAFADGMAAQQEGMAA